MQGRRLVPTPDRDSAPYWAALAQGALHLQNCRDCGHWTWPPRPLCSGCQGERLEWKPVKGTGEVYSWVVAHRAYSPDLTSQVPYIIALVRLEEQDDILIPGRLIGNSTVRQGLRVRVATRRLSDELGELSWIALS